MKELLSIAKETKARNKILASVKRSGWHASDERSPQKRGLPSIADHVVFFHRKHDAIFIGDDAIRVYNALKKLYDEHKKDFDGEPLSEERKQVFIFESIELDEREKNLPVVKCHLSQWNELVPALALCGIGVSGASLDGSHMSWLEEDK